jgi:SAM-dependent methyltransferase
MFRTLVKEVSAGKSIVRALVNDHCGGIEIEGNGLDLGAKDGGASQLRYLDHANATITFSDLHPQHPDVLTVDLEHQIPVEDNSQDFLLLFNVLEHLYDYQTCLSESVRVLRPGGRLIGSVPFLYRVHRDPYDHFRYTEDSLPRLFKEAGFSEIKVKAIGAGPLTASLQVSFGLIHPAFVRAMLASLTVAADSILGRSVNGDWSRVFPLAYVFEVTK